MRAWIASGMLFAVLAIAGTLGGTYLLNRERKLRGAAEAAAEAASLALANQIVENQESRRDLRDSADKLLAENSALKAAFDQARLAAPSAKPVSASHLSTGPLPVQALPPNPMPVRSAPAEQPRDPELDLTCTPCALKFDDSVTIRVDLLELETSKGNTVVVGTAEVRREGPLAGPVAKGSFRSALSTSKEVQEVAPPRWGAMALGACGASGCGPGGAIMFPPWTVLGVRSEMWAGIVVAGQPMVLAGWGARW